jgi:hypothetical protein
MNRWQRAWHAFWNEPKGHKHNQQMRVFTDQGREWLDINLAPRGVKLHLLTKESMPTHGEVNDRNIELFKGWEPLPSTPQWMKVIR